MNEGGKTTRSDIWGGVGWVLFGLLILAESLRMDRFTSMGATIYTMPGFVPGMIGVVLVVLGLVLAFRGLRRQNAETPSTTQDIPAAEAEPIVNGRIGLTMLLTLIYACGLIGRMPFWLCTAVFVSAFTWLFAPQTQLLQQRLLSCLLAGGLTSAVVSLLFQEVFLVRLP